MAASIQPDAVLQALSKVQEPELHRDLVSLNMIKDLDIQDGRVSFTIILTTPACPLKERIERESQEAVMAVPGVETVQIRMGHNVPSDGKPRGNMELPVKNVVAIASGKGGVGKSTVAVNVAVALAQSGAKVGLLDADIYGPNIPTMMGVTELPEQTGGKIIPAEAHGIKLMSIGFMVPRGQAIIWRGPMLHSAIRQFLSDVQWGELDYLIVDLPPGTGDAQISLSQTIPLSGGVIVTLPGQVSIDDASRGLQMFQQVNVPILGVVENMSYLELPDGSRMEIFGNGGGKRLAEAARVPFMGMIPMDPEVRVGGDGGIPIVISAPASAPAKALISLAEKIAARLSVEALSGDSGIKIQMVG